MRRAVPEHHQVLLLHPELLASKTAPAAATPD
jgi:hypothetical protein